MTRNSRSSTWRSPLAAIAGAAVGAVVGAIVAVNIVIFSGIERGYETSLLEVYRQRPLIGVIVTVVLIAGPIAGVIVARRTAGRPTRR